MENVESEAVTHVGERTRRDRATEALGRSWLLFFLIALIGYFWLSTPRGTFLTWTNLQQIALNTSEVILLAIGEMFVIVTAGIDLSIGGILFFSAVAGGEVMLHLAGTSEQTINGQYPHSGIAIPAGIAVCILAGTTWGLINGMLITKLRLPPFIVTLGTFGMTFGFGDLISGGSYLPAPIPPALSNHFGSGKILGLYAPIYVAVFFLIVAHVVLHHTRFGRYTAAIGSNAPIMASSMITAEPASRFLGKRACRRARGCAHIRFSIDIPISGYGWEIPSSLTLRSSPTTAPST